MKLKRISTQETVTLSDGFLWSDEFDWNPIEQKQDRAVDGALIIQEGKKKSGRPITLTADKNMAWLKRHIVSKLKDWSILQEKFELQFNYFHDKRTFKIVFNHQDKAIEANPVLEHPTVSEDDEYNVTLRFLEISDAN
ncbi:MULTISPECIES: hypothetical protein [unclassified Acinetobacter]|uniref:hypothetical protein n=1 Tax=unclassified Acinetobacter TaxID=196816 RepID=UPI0004D6ABD8|nr:MULTISPECIES: hypothetical protein [unclassified Acinetobacter]KEC84216.1 hypothetical protein DT74_09825 [Acinetobacter sp. ETR1]WEE41009.1 hypothetical protein PYV58_07580 [Acinetobacter sp. TAC-1]